jgi:ABC-type multidrug transport system ATPase subunit
MRPLRWNKGALASVLQASGLTSWFGPDPSRRGLSPDQLDLLLIDPVSDRRARTRAMFSGAVDGASTGLLGLALSMPNLLLQATVFLTALGIRPARTWFREWDRKVTRSERTKLKRRARSRIGKRARGVGRILRLEFIVESWKSTGRDDLTAFDYSTDSNRTWSANRMTILTSLVSMGFVSLPLTLLCTAGLIPMWKVYERSARRALEKGDAEKKAEEKHKSKLDELNLDRVVSALQGGDDDWDALEGSIETAAVAHDAAVEDKERETSRGKVQASIAFSALLGLMFMEHVWDSASLIIWAARFAQCSTIAVLGTYPMIEEIQVVLARAATVRKSLENILELAIPRPDDKVDALIQRNLPSGVTPPLELIDAGFLYEEGSDLRPVPALAPLSLAIEPGDFCVILGPMGSGKSTLLYLLTGWEPASTGQVLVAGDYPESWSNLHRQVVLIKGGRKLPALRKPLSMANPTLQDYLMAEAEPEILRNDPDFLKHLASAMNFELQTPLSQELSSGTRDAVVFVKALLSDARVLVFDEIFGRMDGDARNAGLQICREVADSGRTIVAVHHSPTDQNVTAANTIVMLDDGHLVEQGPPDDLLVANGEFARLRSNIKRDRPASILVGRDVSDGGYVAEWQRRSSRPTVLTIVDQKYQFRGRHKGGYVPRHSLDLATIPLVAELSTHAHLITTRPEDVTPGAACEHPVVIDGLLFLGTDFDQPEIAEIAQIAESAHIPAWNPGAPKLQRIDCLQQLKNAGVPVNRHVTIDGRRAAVDESYAHESLRALDYFMRRSDSDTRISLEFEQHFPSHYFLRYGSYQNDVFELVKGTLLNDSGPVSISAADNRPEDPIYIVTVLGGRIAEAVEILPSSDPARAPDALLRHLINGGFSPTWVSPHPRFDGVIRASRLAEDAASAMKVTDLSQVVVRLRDNRPYVDSIRTPGQGISVGVQATEPVISHDISDIRHPLAMSLIDPEAPWSEAVDEFTGRIARQKLMRQRLNMKPVAMSVSLLQPSLRPFASIDELIAEL